MAPPEMGTKEGTGSGDLEEGTVMVLWGEALPGHGTSGRWSKGAKEASGNSLGCSEDAWHLY